MALVSYQICILFKMADRTTHAASDPIKRSALRDQQARNVQPRVCENL